MRVLITGTLGYVGAVVVPHLRQLLPDSELLGFDTGLFGACLTTTDRAPETLLSAQYFGDVRELPASLLQGVDTVVHLAAISNDPIGNRYEQVTDEINRAASLRLAAMASTAGVRNFVFASSCSVYGAGGHSAKHENDALNPLTAYARSKVMTEQALQAMNQDRMKITCLRFATACGISDRVRLDLVLNDFVACALSTGTITVLSDGTPWRPLIDVHDMARGIEWAMFRPVEQGGKVLVVNVGSANANYQVRELAEAVAAVVPGTSVNINAAAPPDARSYQVDFSLFRQLAPNHVPLTSLWDSIGALVRGLRDIGFDDANFRNSRKMIRLNTVASLVEADRLSAELRWRLQTEGAAGRGREQSAGPTDAAEAVA